jgi:putative transposase
MTKRAYKYRFYSTKEQAELLAQTFGCVRYIYNSVLSWRSDEYYQNKTKMGYIQANARLTAIKKEPELCWLKDISYDPLQKTLSKKKLCSANHAKAKVDRIHAKIANSRMDYLHILYKLF